MSIKINWKNVVLLYVSLLLLHTGIAATEPPVISLNGTWELAYWPQPAKPLTTPQQVVAIKPPKVPAKVPGNVELDLMAAGELKDLFIGTNIYQLRKYEGYQWSYSKEFETPAITKQQRVQLFFGGIDCFADIWVNGKHVGTADNMLIEHTFDITEVLEKEKNLVQVIIRSAVIEGMQKPLGTFSIGNFPYEEATYVRKAPASYGWDIMPRAVSAGLWRKVELRIVDPIHFKDVSWMVADIDTARKSARIFTDVQLALPFDKLDEVKARFIIKRKGKIVHEKTVPVLSFAFREITELQNVDFWWPRGYGDPALYDVQVDLLDGNGKVWGTDKKRFGVRTVKLDLNDINKPEDPGRFRFIINGEPVFIKGTNWVPLDALHSRDAFLLQDAMDMVVDMNCNMIRSWGGNVYEDTRFFELCDENGIMVWQDFAMGCTFYPQRDDFRKAIEEEVMSVVFKLRNHPSLVLWSGNNENDEALRWTSKPFNINPNKDIISRQTIERVLYEFDPTRPYLPSSPYYSQRVWEQGSSSDLLPENHLWGPRGYYKDPFYKNATCVFVSEIGYHGCPGKESLKKMMTPGSVYPWTKDYEWNEEWLTKSVRIFPQSVKTTGRNNLMLNQVNLLFGSTPKDLDSFIFASQVMQAEAMKYFVELWRGNKFDNKTGIIWWNIRDGWPIISDAVADYYNNKKLAYHFIKNVQHDIIVLINDPVNGRSPLVATNDTRQAATGDVSVTDVASGKEIFKGRFSVNANSKNAITGLPEMTGNGILLIRYSINGKAYANHYLYGKPPYVLKDYKQLLEKTKIYNLNKFNL